MFTEHTIAPAITRKSKPSLEDFNYKSFFSKIKRLKKDQEDTESQSSFAKPHQNNEDINTTIANLIENGRDAPKPVFKPLETRPEPDLNHRKNNIIFIRRTKTVPKSLIFLRQSKDTAKIETKIQQDKATEYIDKENIDKNRPETHEVSIQYSDQSISTLDLSHISKRNQSIQYSDQSDDYINIQSTSNTKKDVVVEDLEVVGYLLVN
jgi:hypothetical protein